MSYLLRFDCKGGGLYGRARAHLRDNKMQYIEHLLFAFKHSGRCIKAAVMLFIHGLLPCFYRRAGSRLVHSMSKDFTEHKHMKEGKNESTTVEL